MLTTIYIVRHALRCDYMVDHVSGKYSNKFQSPTKIDGDVPLAAKGNEQAVELAAAIEKLSPPADAIYSSPFYRCLQTLSPFLTASSPRRVHLDAGLGEWYGRARFTHPIPASPTTLSKFFPFISPSSAPSIVPSASGESLLELYSRLAYAINTIIAHEDAQPGKGERAILICTHAASMIALGRVLTGREPDDPATDDFSTFTAGISTFRRRGGTAAEVEKWVQGDSIPNMEWRGEGVAGGWDLKVNSDTSYLRDGPERGWHFHGDEDFDLEPPETSGVEKNRRGNLKL